MPKVSKNSAAKVQDIGIGEVREEVVDGYEISFLDLHETSDMAPLLKGLPDDRCPCPHWGYIIKGTVTFTFADHTEVFQAGDAFYAPPSHSPTVAAGTEFVIISPAEQVAEVNEAISNNVQRLQEA
jgi:hypothetical protein